MVADALHGLLIPRIFAHLPHFTFFIAYFPYDHHMSVTHGVANMQSEKKVWQMGQFPRSYPGAGKIASLILAVDLPPVSKVIEIISFFINWSLKYLNYCNWLA